VRISGRLLSSSLLQDLTCSLLQRCSLPAPVSSEKVRSLLSSPALSAVSGHLYYVPGIFPVLYPQSLVICTMSTVSGHSLYCVRSLWSSPVLCPQSLVISCTMTAV
ncbi:unnamed protein product, partial [Staurois parvus]